MKTNPLTNAFGIEILLEPDEPIDAQQVRELLMSTGAVLVRGETPLASFVSVTDELMTRFHQYRGGAFERDLIGGFENLMTTTAAKVPFPVPLHGECYYMPDRPQVIWFYCQRPSSSGNGPTLLCDGTELLESLDQETRGFFEANEVNYLRRMPREVWASVFGTEDVDRVVRFLEHDGFEVRLGDEGRTAISSFTTSAISSSLHTQARAFINTVIPALVAEEMAELMLGPPNKPAPDYLSAWIPETQKDRDALRETLAEMQASGRDAGVLVRTSRGARLPDAVRHDVLTTASRLTYEVDWSSGDILGVDNTRVMHGRGFCDDPERSVLCRIGDLA